MSGIIWNGRYVEMPRHLLENGGNFEKMVKEKSRAYINVTDKLQECDSWSRFLISRAQLEQDRLVCSDNWVFAWKKICIVMDFQSERAEECLLNGFEGVIKRAECAERRLNSVMQAWPHYEAGSKSVTECVKRMFDPNCPSVPSDFHGVRIIERDRRISTCIVMMSILDDATYWFEDVLTSEMGEHAGAMLFIRQMQVAQEELLKIFEGTEHLAYMILIFMFLAENPGVSILPPKRL